jgi:hypothetical protein
MVLDDNIILQTDGTVIAGLLILLTVAYYLAPRSSKELAGELAIYTLRKISRFVIAVILSLSASAILVILGNVFDFYYAIILVTSGKITMVVGFVALATGITWLMYGYATKSWTEIQRGTEESKGFTKSFFRAKGALEEDKVGS